MKIFIGIMVTLIIALGGYLVYDKYFKKAEPVVVTTPAPTQTTPTPTETAIKHVSDPGVTWLKEPKKINNLNLVKEDKSDYSIVDPVYYQIATLDSGGEIILLTASTFSGMGGNDYYARFKKDKDGKYSYLLKHSFEQNYENADKFLVNDVSIDGTTIYQSLSAPDFLETKNGVLKKSTFSFLANFLFKDLKNPKEIIDTTYGFIYRTQNKEDAQEIDGIFYNLKLADTTLVQYIPKFDFLTDDEVALVTWKDNTKNSAKFTPEGYVACGSVASINAIINMENINSRLIDAGKTDAGDKIYTVAKDDVVTKAAYENYKIGREKDILSIDEFVKKNPVFIWKNGFGDYIIFTGRDFAGLAECGKPVIYLYPEKPTQISVKVGAEITKSDPLYNEGWNVLAEPSGKLHLANQIYDYLFWEGTGQEYPNIESGFIVKYENIEATLKDHLSKLGLNAKESADFMEFWLPKMPNDLYIRLTWFGTAQMNKLAPLSVNPKPDTMIRIFLDFEGLDKPMNVTPQKLGSIERKGFTLVEWGGLLK